LVACVKGPEICDNCCFGNLGFHLWSGQEIGTASQKKHAAVRFIAAALQAPA
jgi:hypothetical protein